MPDANSPDTLIVGYPGRLARAFAWLWPAARRLNRRDLDICARKTVLSTLIPLRPKLVINCAAMTDMRRCEDEPDLAWDVNVRGVRNIAEACAATGAFLVHFSSDYAIAPVNEYGWTKRASEGLADLTVRAKIFDETHWALRALRAGQQVEMLTNEFLNPISTTGSATLTAELLMKKARGLISAGTKERLSFYQVGCVWAQALGVKTDRVIQIDQLPDAGQRLQDMYMDTQALAQFGIRIPTLLDDTRAHLERLTTLHESGA